MRTGIDRMPWMKFEYVRRGAANTSMTGVARQQFLPQDAQLQFG